LKIRSVHRAEIITTCHKLNDNKQARAQIEELGRELAASHHDGMNRSIIETIITSSYLDNDFEGFIQFTNTLKSIKGFDSVLLEELPDELRMFSTVVTPDVEMKSAIENLEFSYKDLLESPAYDELSRFHIALGLAKLVAWRGNHASAIEIAHRYDDLEVQDLTQAETFLILSKILLTVGNKKGALIALEHFHKCKDKISCTLDRAAMVEASLGDRGGLSRIREYVDSIQDEKARQSFLPHLDLAEALLASRRGDEPKSRLSLRQALENAGTPTKNGFAYPLNRFMFLCDLAVVACESNDFETARKSMEHATGDLLPKDAAVAIVIRDLLRDRNVKAAILVSNTYDKILTHRFVFGLARDFARHGDVHDVFDYAVGLQSVALRAEALAGLVNAGDHLGPR